VFVCAIPIYKGREIYGSGGHSVTMKKVKFKKHPAKMTSDELAEGVFHPKVLKAIRKHLETPNPSKRPVKSSK
jgi:hypothetical protein